MIPILPRPRRRTPPVGETWADRPVERALYLWVFPVVGMLFSGALAGIFWHQGRQDHKVGYVASAPVNCRLGLADRPGGPTRHTVEQAHSARTYVCDPPARGTRIFYDPRTRREVGDPGGDRTGVLVFGGLASVSLAGGGVARSASSGTAGRPHCARRTSRPERSPAYRASSAGARSPRGSTLTSSRPSQPAS